MNDNSPNKGIHESEGSKQLTAMVVGRDNSYGLSKDRRLLGKAMEKTGISVSYSTPRSRPFFDRILSTRRYDIVIHTERAFPQWFSAGTVNVLIPNSERFPQRHVKYLRHIDLVMTKSRHAIQIFAGKNTPTRYIGFASDDRRNHAIKQDMRKCLHLAGGSTLKGTEVLLQTWSEHPDWPELIVVQRKPVHASSSNIRIIDGYLDDKELMDLQNRCGVHLCPSLSEGWGHHIVEAMSCGALIVTNDAPPMNEHVNESCGILNPVSIDRTRNLDVTYRCSASDLASSISKALNMPTQDALRLGKAARERFDQRTIEFTDNISATPWLDLVKQNQL